MTDSEKINIIQRLTGLTWVEMAAKVGLKSPQTFTDIRTGRHGLSNRLACRILDVFPEINREWLLLDKGPVTAKTETGLIPLYSDQLSIGSNNEPISTINPGTLFAKADVAVRVNDESMAEYPQGSIVFLKRITDFSILVPGTTYLVIASPISMMRRVQLGADADHYSLYATNQRKYEDGRALYEPIEVSKNSIENVFQVLGYAYVQAPDI